MWPSVSLQPVITMRIDGHARERPAISAIAGLDVGQARVDERDVRASLLDELECRAHVAGTTDDGDLTGDAQQVGQALHHAAIGIDDHHPRG